MSGDTKKIFEKQNEPKFIAMLAAQRRIYSSAKKWNNVFLLISVIVPFLSILVQEFLSFDFRKFAIGSAFFWLIYFVFNNFIVFNKKRKAVQIQELFDTQLFGIDWSSKVKRIKEINTEFVEREAVKLDKQDGLKNWYSDYSDEDKNLAILKCQQENLRWDGDQRAQYVWLLLLSFVFIFLIYALLASHALSEKSILILLPLSGFFLFCSSALLGNIYASYRLNSKYYDLKYQSMYWERLPSDDQLPFIRKVQDFIYYRRKLSPLVPDWFYKQFKNGVRHKVYSFDSGKGEIRIETNEWSFFPKNRLSKAVQSFDQAFDSVDELSQSVVKKLETADAQEITLEMSVKVSGDVGAYIAKATGEGQMKVTVKWQKSNKLST
jgi:hypothetical protein